MKEKGLVLSMSWMSLISGIERLAAVLQTILVARALGITDYGVYGLIFGTIGLAASVAGMQMGLTATVFVARYRDSEKAKAAYVVAFASRFGILAAILFLFVTLPFATFITLWLVGSSGHEISVIFGCLLVACSVGSGVQDGVIQGFEDFRSVAFVRLITTVFTLVCTYPMGAKFGLSGVLAAVLLGLIIKCFLLQSKVGQHVRNNRLPARGHGIHARDLLFGFSVPSMLVSLFAGAIGWIGTFMLSRQTSGFDSLAIVNTGLQWRGPIFLLTSSVSSVAVPALSRHYQAKEHSAIRGLHRKILIFSGGFSLLISVTLMALSPSILMLYGPNFADGALIFSIVVISAVPQVVAGAYMQVLVAKGQMWRQLQLHFWLVVPLGLCFAIFIPQMHGTGFAIANLLAWTIFAVALALSSRPDVSSKPVLSADTL